MLKRLLLILCFFGSGATSLSLQVAWSKELSYLLGVDLYASTTVVTAFMAGLGLGAILVSRFQRWEKVSLVSYAALQLVIGLCGLVSIPLFRATLPLFSLLFDLFGTGDGLFLLVRFAVVFGLMMVPVTLMGMTLPIVVGASHKGGRGPFAAVAGLFYGVNTIGAVCGTLLAGFLLVPNVGLLRTCLTTGAVDLVIAAIAFSLQTSLPAEKATSKKTEAKAASKKRREAKAHPPTPAVDVRALNADHRVIGGIFLCSGVTALALEICWFRMLAQIIGPSVHAFSIMLAIYLTGIGVGSLIGARPARTTHRPRALMAALLWLIGMAALASLFYLNQLPIWYAKLVLAIEQPTFSIQHLLAQSVVASLLMLPATLLMGVLFPVVMRVYAEASQTGNNADDDARLRPSVGLLYFLNTVGGVIGSLAAGFWLIPHIGPRTSLIGAAFLSVLLAVVVATATSSTKFPRRLPVPIAGAALAALLLFLAPGIDQIAMNIGVYAEMYTPEFKRHIEEDAPLTTGELLFLKPGINNNVAVMANLYDDGNLTLHLSGHWVSTTEFYGRIHLHFLGHLPMLFARENESAAVIGFGTGITSGALLRYDGLERLDLFEIEPGVIEAGDYFDYINGRPLEDPRTRLITEDGRSQLTYRDATYDVITADPIHPFVAGSGNLYSKDFYEIARFRLKSGGVFCQWIPLSSISQRSYNAVLGTLHSVFPHVALFSCFGESIVVASAEPLRIDWPTFERRFFHEPVFEDFKRLDILSPYNLFAFYEGGGEQIDRYLAKHEPIITTDDNVWLEHHMPFEGFTVGMKSLIHTLRDEIPPSHSASLRAMVPGIPLDEMGAYLAELSRNTEEYHRLARLALDAGDSETAAEYQAKVFEDVASVHFYDAGLGLARHLHDEGRVEEAVRALRAVQEKHPARGVPYLAEAAMLKAAGRISDALEATRRGLMFNPEDADLADLKRRLLEASDNGPLESADIGATGS